MATLSQHAPGTFCWPELSTSDSAGAAKYYGALFGWSVREVPTGPDAPPYRIFQMNGKDVGAGYDMQAEQRQQGIPPHWGAYVSVTDADAAARKAKELGATVIMEPFDVMDHGRMAILQDPTGAVFQVWQAKSHIGATVIDEPNTLAWTELYTTDPAKAKDFYTQLIGWTAADLPMGDMTYTLFKRADGTSAAGCMKTPAEAQGMPPHWMTYFQAADLQKSTDRAAELGGKILMPPTPIPNVGAFSMIQDPQGATFGLLTLNAQ